MLLEQCLEHKTPESNKSVCGIQVSQGVRRFALRQSRYIGLARTHLQQVLTATAMNVVRVIDWLRGKPLGEKRRPAGRFMRLAPAPLVSGALTSAGVT